MPKLATPLTDIQVRNAKPKDKPYTMADGGGMYLEVAPTGSKIWRMSYRQPSGKNNRLTFGPYPEVSLLDARQKRMDAKKQRAAGIDPAQALSGGKVIEQVSQKAVADVAKMSKAFDAFGEGIVICVANGADRGVQPFQCHCLGEAN